MGKKRKESYYDKLESSHVGMNMRFDRAPYMMLVANLICGLIYAVDRGVAMDSELTGLVNVMTIVLCVSVFWGVIYTISALFKRTRKTFPLAITSLFVSFMFLMNMIPVTGAIREFEHWIEWVVLAIFAGLLCAWVVFTIRRLRQEMRGETLEPLEIPFWLIYVAIIPFAPILSFSGRHGLGKLVSQRVIIWLFTVVIFELDLVLTRFLFKLILFCKGRLSGRI